MTGEVDLKLREALNSALTEDDLEQLLNGINKKLSDHTAANKPLPDQIGNVIAAARRQGWFDELVEAAYKWNPGNPKLDDFYKNVDWKNDGGGGGGGGGGRPPMQTVVAVAIVAVTVALVVGLLPQIRHCGETTTTSSSTSDVASSQSSTRASSSSGSAGGGTSSSSSASSTSSSSSTSTTSSSSGCSASDCAAPKRACRASAAAVGRQLESVVCTSGHWMCNGNPTVDTCHCHGTCR
jgi:effector-associated domain 1 (EAD1)-containing protein